MAALCFSTVSCLLPFSSCSHGRRAIRPRAFTKLCVVSNLHDRQNQGLVTSRREMMWIPSAIALVPLLAGPAAAFITAPPGYRLHEDKLDGYYFFYPEVWSPVTTSGNDTFYRNPYKVDENLFVDLSSPSSSKYKTVADLISPEAAAKRTLDQYLEEYMSTRIGVKREAEVVSATSRIADDGKEYYDIGIVVRSYASRNQLAVSQKEIDKATELEWERQFFTVLGVANKRLYEFRFQTNLDTYQTSKDEIQKVLESFRCKEVVAL